MNRLSKETSPYLRQHANNPVDWYPWGEEALSCAKELGKPILLSIGYAACHWCHVMEHESFENPEIAKLMNDYFINIKVDREERPDLDQIYQNVAQLMTGGGGWPLTVFLTPDLEPFFGGTYFPPTDRYGRPGFPKVLTSLTEAYHSKKEDVLANAEALKNAMLKMESTEADEKLLPSKQNFKEIADRILSFFDWKNGGFGSSPKFPNPMNLFFLWRHALATDFGMAEEAVLLALTKMAEGGIYDQIGGGFHRYSVDSQWAVPHFEKMLYDNALLLKLYSEVLSTSELSAFGIPKDSEKLFLKTIIQTLTYLDQEMKSPNGAYYSTLDADSEGEEGIYYVWSKQDVEALVSKEDAHLFCETYGITETGNFENTGKTVLALKKSENDLAIQTGLSLERITESLKNTTNTLKIARDKKIKPGLDHKILTSWNGLLISGFCAAASTLIKRGEEHLAHKTAENAKAAFEFITTQMIKDPSSGELHSVFGANSVSEMKLGKAFGDAFLDDYAFMCEAAIAIYACPLVDHETRINALTYLKKWTAFVYNGFKDESAYGFYFTSTKHEKLLLRPKTIYDQAIPSGNAVFLKSAIVLEEIEPGALAKINSSLETFVHDSLYFFYNAATKNPFGMGELLNTALLNKTGAAVHENKIDFIHPHFFEKPGASMGEDKVKICHAKACREVVPNRKIFEEYIKLRT